MKRPVWLVSKQVCLDPYIRCDISFLWEVLITRLLSTKYCKLPGTLTQLVFFKLLALRNQSVFVTKRKRMEESWFSLSHLTFSPQCCCPCGIPNAFLCVLMLWVTFNLAILSLPTQYLFTTTHLDSARSLTWSLARYQKLIIEHNSLPRCLSRSLIPTRHQKPTLDRRDIL